MIADTIIDSGTKRQRNQAAYIRRKKRFAKIVADHTPFRVDSVCIARWNKANDYRGKWSPGSRVLEMPRPINTERLAVCLHEIGHAVNDRHLATSKHELEQIADEFMEKVLKQHGLSVPLSLWMERRATMFELLENDIKAGCDEIDWRVSERLGLNAQDLREMGATESQIPSTLSRKRLLSHRQRKQRR